MTIKIENYHHIRLTVTDIERSRAFYDDLFGLPVAFEVPDDADEATREALSFLFGGVIYQFGTSLFGLRPVADDRFDENRVGLDHRGAKGEPPGHPERHLRGVHRVLLAVVQLADPGGAGRGPLRHQRPGRGPPVGVPRPRQHRTGALGTSALAAPGRTRR